MIVSQISPREPHPDLLSCVIRERRKRGGQNFMTTTLSAHGVLAVVERGIPEEADGGVCDLLGRRLHAQARERPAACQPMELEADGLRLHSRCKSLMRI